MSTKMISKACFAIFLSFILFSCKKKENEIKFSFDVSVSDYYSNTPIQGVAVSAYVKGVSSGTYSNTYQLQASQSTNSGGHSLFDIPYSGLESIKISLAKDGFFGQSFEYNPDIFSTENLNELTLHLKQKGIISIRINNTSPFDTFDEITFNTINSDCSECVKFNSLVLTGTQVDTTLHGTVVVNRHYKYQYIVTKNGGATNYLDSTLCTGDTTFININY